MTRDELLDKLAMELGEWPEGVGPHTNPSGGHFCPDMGGDWVFVREEDFPGREGITKIEWQSRRNQLINKPSWESAPEWAEWLAQDADGEWWWYRSEPYRDEEEDNWNSHDELFLESGSGATLTGHNWRDTLERRPEDSYNEARIDVVGQNGATGEHYDEAQDAVNALFALREAVREAGSPIVPDEPDPVNHPEHYQGEGGIECIDAIRASLGLEGFVAYCRGNAIKYAFRSGRKERHAEDLRKGAWYLERAASAIESEGEEKS